jgi:hypothetical protein
LKPKDLELSDSGYRFPDLTPKITDFGLAKDHAAAGKLTQTNVTMGPPCYMAPEQAWGSGVGQAADIYALGSILYEMLTGRPPFQGGTAAETLDQLRHEEPLSPARLRPRLPRDLVTICLKCLEKTPVRRYTSALDLAEDLRRFQAGESIRARPVGPLGRSLRWCRRRPLVAGLSLLTALLTGGLVITVLVYNAHLTDALALAEKANAVQRQQIIQLNVNIGITALDGGDAFAAVLRFAEALRLDTEDAGRQSSHRNRIAAALKSGPRLLDLRQLQGNVLCTQRQVNGRWLAALQTGQQLQVFDVLTGRTIGPVLPLDHLPRSGAISPDGRSLATINPEGVVTFWELDVGKSYMLSGQAAQPARAVHFEPQRRILVVEHDDASLRRWDTGVRPLADLGLCHETISHYSTVTGNARCLFTQDAALVGQVWEAATGKPVGMPLKSSQAAKLVRLNDDGSRLAYLGVDGTVDIWDVIGARRVGLAIQPGPGVSHMAISPDGKRVLCLGSDRGLRIWHVDSGKQSVAALPRDLPPVHAQFSPDGRLVLATITAGLLAVWDSETGRALTPPLRHGGSVPQVAFHAGGQRLAILNKTGTVSVWALPFAPSTEGPIAVDAQRMPVTDLVLLAQVLAGARINDGQEAQALESAEILTCWRTLQNAS